MNPKVDLYLEEGCGRCSLYQTPDCKVHTWKPILVQLRRIVLETGLEEEYKWSQPCYTWKNANVVMVTAFKDHAVLAFFKGSLLQDPSNILISPGENSQSSKVIRFTDVNEVLKQEALLKAYIYEAIEVEKSGLKVEFKKNPEPIPVELIDAFESDSVLKEAFYALTAGRQRGYILYFSAPKQSKTRQTRIEKLSSQIKAGIGINDKYSSGKK
ncbi:YdeI family protein [Algoriphagus namhaensis]|uniref:YdeI family protein n=1 Tax=Algoriphagus namhaensis TaxID=915353 RepID=A0ABV8APB7_9BACT